MKLNNYPYKIRDNPSTNKLITIQPTLTIIETFSSTDTNTMNKCDTIQKSCHTILRRTFTRKEDGGIVRQTQPREPLLLFYPARGELD